MIRGFDKLKEPLNRFGDQVGEEFTRAREARR